MAKEYGLSYRLPFTSPSGCLLVIALYFCSFFLFLLPLNLNPLDKWVRSMTCVFLLFSNVIHLERALILCRCRSRNSRSKKSLEYWRVGRSVKAIWSFFSNRPFTCIICYVWRIFFSLFVLQGSQTLELFQLLHDIWHLLPVMHMSLRIRALNRLTAGIWIWNWQHHLMANLFNPNNNRRNRTCCPFTCHI